MTLRYLADEHVANAVVTGLRRRGVTVATISDVGLLGASDDELLQFAQREGYVIATQDQDFLRLAARVDQHAGIVYAPQGRAVGDLVRWLYLLAQISVPDEMRGRVEYL